ncbi:hypothetical protein KY284_001341 [Solanum tuberosum]|nr:hypothetical protein KY284_001341 [Solanum tuberosum]
MALESNYMQAAIPRFDGHYDHWSMLMENFKVKGVLANCGGWYQFSGGRRNLDKCSNNRSIERPMLETILCKETSKDISDSMKKKYQGTVRVKCALLRALRRDFETLQMKEGESVMSY